LSPCGRINFNINRKTIYEEINNEGWAEKCKYESIGYECIFAYTTITKRYDRIYSMLYTKIK